MAMKSYDSLSTLLSQIKSDKSEIEIEETGEKIVLSRSVLKLLAEILKAMSKGYPVSIMPLATEVTTQQAAEMIGCSRPFLVRLLEEGKIPFTKVGKHRRIRFEDLIAYKKKMRQEQKQHIIDIMHEDENDGLYDS